MENQELMEMLEEDSKQTKFEKWGNENVGFFSSLSEEEKTELRKEYENADSWKNTYQNTFENALSHMGSNIDYQNDLEKVGLKRDRAVNQLNQTLETLSTKYENHVRK